MAKLTYKTAGESHGPCIAALVEGFPAGVTILEDAINAELRRRQGGYGRGERMTIETDTVRVLSGVMKGATIGSPILLVVDNKDAAIDEKAPVICPRPGHSDLAGMMKYGFDEARPALERASARETAGKVAAGALAMTLLSDMGIDVFAHILSVGTVISSVFPTDFAAARRTRNESDLYCLDAAASEDMRTLIDKAREEGDTLGGTFEVIVRGAPPGLGSYVQAPLRMDGRLAACLMSIPAIKGVEIGLGFESASRAGSQVHDPILPGAGGLAGLERSSNNAGGLEAGITNGQDIVLRAAMKPIATLMQPLATINVTTGQPAAASVERSDVCAVPAASVVGEAVVAFEIAAALLEKFGGDSFAETRRNCNAYLKDLRG